MSKIVKNQQGFTLIEIIAVLVLLGILAAVAVPKYMNMAEDARIKAAQGQIAEVKGRLNAALGRYMLNNNGASTDAATLVTYANTTTAGSCPTALTTEGDFEFKCAGASQVVTITVTKVQTATLATPVTGDFTVP